jgi:hypothetical protein
MPYPAEPCMPRRPAVDQTKMFGGGEIALVLDRLGFLPEVEPACHFQD